MPNFSPSAWVSWVKVTYCSSVAGRPVTPSVMAKTLSLGRSLILLRKAGLSRCRSCGGRRRRSVCMAGADRMPYSLMKRPMSSA